MLSYTRLMGILKLSLALTPQQPNIPIGFEFWCWICSVFPQKTELPWSLSLCRTCPRESGDGERESST